MLSRSSAHTVLILDDNPGDALLLKQLLSSLPGQAYIGQTHHSSQGVFPTDPATYELVFVAEGYANTELLQLLQLLGARYPDAAVALLNDGEHSAPQLLIDAAHAGLNQVLSKGSLSRDTLLACILALKPAATAPAAITSAPASKSMDSSPQRTTLPTQTIPAPSQNELEDLSTGVIRLRRKDQQFIISAINSAATKLENLSAANCLGSIADPRLFDYQNLDMIEQLQALRPAETQRHHDIMRLDSDGNVSWRDLSIRDLGDDQLLIELHDANARAREDREQIDEHSIWRHIVSSYPELSALIDEEGNIVELISGPWASIQTDTETLPGQTLSSLLSEDQRQTYRDMLSKALNTGKAQQSVFRLELSDGPIYLHTSLSLLRTDAGADRHALLVATDVTDIFERQESLAAELNIMKEFSRRAPFALAIKDADGRFERANPYFLDLFGLRHDDVIGKSEIDLFDQELAEQLTLLDAQMLRSQDVVEANIQVDPDDWMVYRFIKLPLHGGEEHSQASCLLVLPSDADDQAGATESARSSSTAKRTKSPAQSATTKKKSATMTAKKT